MWSIYMNNEHVSMREFDGKQEVQTFSKKFPPPPHLYKCLP